MFEKGCMLVGLFFVNTTSVKIESLSPLSPVKIGNKSPCGNIDDVTWFESSIVRSRRSGDFILEGTTWDNWFGGDDINNRNESGQFDVTTADNWIRVPMLCQFTFMTGSNVNKKLIQFKPCAIQAVEVNYTPDGTYATYSDGSPVAIELRLNFMETKLLYSNEVGYQEESTDGAGLGY